LKYKNKKYILNYTVPDVKVCSSKCKSLRR